MNKEEVQLLGFEIVAYAGDAHQINGSIKSC